MGSHNQFGHLEPESCNGYPYPWVPNTHPYPWVNGWVMGMGLDAWVGNGWL